MKRLYGLFLLITATLPASAQTEATMYFMNSLPQFVSSNPAFTPKYHFSFGLPVISSVGAGYYNNGFSYNDIVTKSGDEVKGDLSKWQKALTKRNYITSTAQIDVFRLGLRINSKLYVQANMTAHEYVRLQIPKEFSSLFVEGTTPLVGTSTSFSPQAEALAYLETAVGAAYQVNEKLSVGARLKFLYGIANATTVSSEMNVSIGNDYQFSTSADMNVKTSGLHDHETELKNFRSNTGFGIDLGGTYKLTNRITLAASLVDLGKINWKNNTYSYTLDKNTATYSFSGFDLHEVVNGNSGYLHAQSDSIGERFKPKETKISSYSTVLPAKMYLSGNYLLMRNLNVGALFFTETFQGRVAPGISASLIKHFGKLLTTSLSYTVSNRSYNNIGAGLSFNFAPIQIYVVGDNLLRMPASLISTGHLNSYLNSTQVFNLRFGLNFIWGRDKNVDGLPNKSYNVKENGSSKEKVTDGDNSKSFNSNGKPKAKTKVTKGDPSYLKVRKRTRR